jgi:non-heme chloroperoxidase
MNYVTTKDGAKIYYKDWGTGQPIVFSHGWPLCADAWDVQMLFLLQKGYRVIALATKWTRMRTISRPS